MSILKSRGTLERRLAPLSVELYLSRTAFGTAPVTRDILAEQQAIADTFLELKLIPKKLNLLHAAPVDLA